VAVEEEKKVAQDNASHKLWFFWIVVAILLLSSIGVTDLFLNGGKTDTSYMDYFAISPFSNDKISQKYYHEYWWYSILMLFISLLVRFFYLGNPKRNYIKKLEKIKRFLLDFIPLYIDGSDSRNNYIRFGMRDSFKNGFLERKISQGKYLKKVSYLKIFTGKYSPDHILNLKTNYINNAFVSNHYYIDLFKIIEGYITGNIDTWKNVPLKKYWAIGTNATMYTDDSIDTFIETYVPSESHKSYQFSQYEAKQKFISLKKSIAKLENKEKIKEKRTFVKILLKNKIQKYKNHVNKMVVFSPLAVKEAIEMIVGDAKRFLDRNIELHTSLINKISPYGKVTNTELLEIFKFVIFYKIINNFMGLPSGIVTARIENYTLSRIIDDLEIFEKNIAVRQIKSSINDKKGKYDDTKAKAYMVFHHEFFLNSLNSQKLKDILERFDALRTISQEDLPDIDLSTFNISPDEKFEYVKKNIKDNEEN